MPTPTPKLEPKLKHINSQNQQPKEICQSDNPNIYPNPMTQTKKPNIT